MKRVLRADHLVALALFAAGFLDAVEPGQLDQRFVGFGPAVAEKHPAGAGVADETLRELALKRMAVEIADVNERAGLSLHGGDPARVAMAEGIDPREIWLAICEAAGVPKNRWHGANKDKKIKPNIQA